MILSPVNINIHNTRLEPIIWKKYNKSVRPIEPTNKNTIFSIYINLLTQLINGVNTLFY